MSYSKLNLNNYLCAETSRLPGAQQLKIEALDLSQIAVQISKLRGLSLDALTSFWSEDLLPLLDQFELVTSGRGDPRALLILNPNSLKLSSLKIATSTDYNHQLLESFLLEHLPNPKTTLQLIPTANQNLTSINTILEQYDGLIVPKFQIDLLLNDPKFALPKINFMVLPLSSCPARVGLGTVCLVCNKNTQIPKKFGCLETQSSFLTEIKSKNSWTTILSREYGKLLFKAANTSASVSLIREAAITHKTSLNNLWPIHNTELELFKREALKNLPQPSDFHNRCLWISKSEALPKSWSINADQVVWTAGLTTWKKLALRGIWVNGCAEGLGEDESPRISRLIGYNPNWLKLTHADGFESQEMEVLATYKLVPIQTPIIVELKNKSHFFWSSGSQFLRAMELLPEIKDARHFCGPGNTYKIIFESLGTNERINIVLSKKDWVESIVIRNKEENYAQAINI